MTAKQHEQTSLFFNIDVLVGMQKNIKFRKKEFRLTQINLILNVGKINRGMNQIIDYFTARQEANINAVMEPLEPRKQF